MNNSENAERVQGIKSSFAVRRPFDDEISFDFLYYSKIDCLIQFAQV